MYDIYSNESVGVMNFYSMRVRGVRIWWWRVGVEVNRFVKVDENIMWRV